MMLSGSTSVNIFTAAVGPRLDYDYGDAELSA